LGGTAASAAPDQEYRQRKNDHACRDHEIPAPACKVSFFLLPLKIGSQVVKGSASSSSSPCNELA